MKIRFVIASTFMVLFVVAGWLQAGPLFRSGRYIEAVPTLAVAVIFGGLAFYALRPEPPAESLAKVGTEAEKALPHPEIHQDSSLRRTAVQADREQDTGRLNS